MGLAVARLTADPEVLVILLGGSIAKGLERPESDVDLMVVVPDEVYRRRLAENQVTFFYQDIAGWPNGYVEGRYLSRDFVLTAAERGSEPTRYSFTGVTVLYGDDPEIVAAIPRIPIYPESERLDRIDAFHAQLFLNRIYFWPEGVRRQDPYLKLRAATEIVLFGGRMVLAHHRVLFPNQKRLLETLDKVQPDIADLAREFLSRLNDDSLIAFNDRVIALTQPCPIDLGSRFTQDSEMSWFNRTHSVAEW